MQNDKNGKKLRHKKIKRVKEKRATTRVQLFLFPGGDAGRIVGLVTVVQQLGSSLFVSAREESDSFITFVLFNLEFTINDRNGTIQVWISE